METGLNRHYHPVYFIDNFLDEPGLRLLLTGCVALRCRAASERNASGVNKPLAGSLRFFFLR